MTVREYMRKRTRVHPIVTIQGGNFEIYISLFIYWVLLVRQCRRLTGFIRVGVRRGAPTCKEIRPRQVMQMPD